MDKTEIKKLKALLNHWVDHTDEHSNEFAEWAQKLGSSQYSEIRKCMISASKGMESARDSLSAALKELEKFDKQFDKPGA